jgi:WD40 repeat protein
LPVAAPPAGLRGPNVRLWEAATGKLIRAAKVDGEPACSLAVSPDGKLLAGGSGKEILLWDVPGGKLVRRLTGHKESVLSVAFSADGRRLHSLAWEGEPTLAAHADAGEVRCWDVATGRLLRSWNYSRTGRARRTNGKAQERVTSLVLAPGGARLFKSVALLNVTQEGNFFSREQRGEVLRLWDVPGGKQAAELAGLRGKSWNPSVAGGNWGPVFSPDGRRFAVRTSGGIYIGDGRTGMPLLKVRTDAFLPSAPLFTPDGNRLVVAYRCGPYFPLDQLLPTHGGGLQLWDLRTRKKLWDTAAAAAAGGGPPSPCRLLACSADGRTLAGARGSAVFLWALRTGRERHAFQGHREPVQYVRFTRDGRGLISCSGSLYCRWDVATGEEVGRITGDRIQSRGYWPAYSPDGTLSLCVHGKALRLCETAGGKVLHTLRAPHNGKGQVKARFSADGSILLLLAERGTKLWARVVDTATGKELGKVLLTGGDADAVLELTTRWTDWRDYVAASPGGKYLAWSGKYGAVCLADVATGKVIDHLGIRETGPGKDPWHDAQVVLFAPDGRPVAAFVWPRYPESGDDPEIGVVRVWEVPSGRLVRRFVVREWHRRPVALSCAAFSADGRTLAFGKRTGRAVRLWEVVSGQERARLEGHRGAVRSVAFSPDGRRLASGSEDGTILVWDVHGPTTAPAAGPAR